MDVLTPAKAATAHGGEDLTQRALVGVGHRAVGEDEVELLVLRVASLCASRPLVFIGGVVEDEVEHEADALLLKLAG